ncbi:hypothetical protein ASC77_05575 [Nocardioides sp. Root1257]|nr:hypothetical protein ASC77_05575 [Nocardioides sp. Root1257]KRC56416.1 hypothetical protein ASE24_05575 [Nocardioides sp. Root224]
MAAVREWPVESQQRSRRNAMIASTALAQRRAELHDVEDFLAALDLQSARDQAPTSEVAAQAAHG